MKHRTAFASHDAKVVAANQLEGNHREPDCAGVSSVAFTIPPIAWMAVLLLILAYGPGAFCVDRLIGAESRA